MYMPVALPGVAIGAKTGTAEAPGGAHFTTCEPDYGRDEAFQARYASAVTTTAR